MSAEDWEAALREYASVEPPAGLEERVMARVRAEGRRRRIPGLWLAAAAAVCGAMFVWMNIRPVEKQVQPAPMAAMVSNPLPPVYTLRITSIRRRHVRYGLPVQETFPAHPQVTAEERAFLQLIREHPDSAKALLSRTEPAPIVPIEIPELTIRPLEH